MSATFAPEIAFEDLDPFEPNQEDLWWLGTRQ